MLQNLLTRARREELVASAAAAMRDPFAWLTTLFALGFLWQPWMRIVDDPDYGWLVWLGNNLLSGTVPRTNGFSWTVPDMPWVSHEALVGLVYAAAGPDWVAWLRGIVISATVVLLLVLTHRRNNPIASCAAFTWAIALIVCGVSERPLSWGNLMLALVTLLVTGKKPARWRFVLAALMVGLWANIHGSFIIGVFIVGLANWRWGIAAALATLANPYGIHLWELVIGYGAGEGVTGLLRGVINEWSSPDFTDPMTVLRFALLFLAGALIVWTHARTDDGKWDWRDAWRPALLFLALTALALDHWRFIDVAAIALAPWLATALERLMPTRRAALPWPQFAIMLPVLAFLSRDVGIDRKLYPLDLPFEELQGKRLWNNFRLGGYLGQHGVRVFWDGRNDCYTTEIFRDGLTIQWMRPGWQDRLDKWRIDAILSIQPRLVDLLKENGWQEQGKWGDVTLLTRPPMAPEGAPPSKEEAPAAQAG